MKIKSAAVFCATVLFVLTAIWISPSTCPVFAQKAGNVTDSKVTSDKAPSRQVVAYYFHGTRRCRTCLTIESLTKVVVQNDFSAALKKGSLKWQVINVETPENRHFINDFKLYTKSVVLVEIVDGKQVRWKNLARIWDLVRDEEAFKAYIHDEIKAWMSPPAEAL